MDLNLESVYREIMAEDVASLLARFTNGHAMVTMASFGTISCDRVFAMLVKKIANRFRYLKVEARSGKAFRGEGCAVAEGELIYQFYDEERRQALPYLTPVALVCGLADDGSIERMNVYAGFDAFVGKQILRPAMYNADAAAAAALPADIQAYYAAREAEERYEVCRVHALEGAVAVEENALFTQGDICTPQAHMTVFDMENGVMKAARAYGEIVWDFKLWPTLY